jgi:formiminoglutamate deiminase
MEERGVGGKMTSLWFQTALLPEGWSRHVRIILAEGLIAQIETGVSPEINEPRHFAAIPALANVHSHAFQRGMAGLAERRGASADNFWTWRDIMYQFLDRITPDDCAALAAQSYMEMLESGFTRVAEFHYLHHDEAGKPYANPAEMAEKIAEAATITGIGLTLLPVFYAHANFDCSMPHHGQRRFVTHLDQFGALVAASRRAIKPLVGAVLGIAPHSLRAATPDEIAAIVPLAENGPIHIHAAEQAKEVADCEAWHRRRPIELLLEQAGVNAKWCLIHATHMTDHEVKQFASSGAVAGLCPITEANLGDGVFPAADFIKDGGTLAIGSDSNIMIAAAQELRQLEYAQRLQLRGRNILAGDAGLSTGRSLFDAALHGGAQAVGIEPPALIAGSVADIIALDQEAVCFVGRAGDALLDSWIFASRGQPIAHVWRAGVPVVIDGRHRARERIEARYRAVMARILA